MFLAVLNGSMVGCEGSACFVRVYVLFVGDGGVHLQAARKKFMVSVSK